VESKAEPVSLGLSRVKLGIHINQTAIVWKLNPYVCYIWSHSCTHFLTLVTVIGNVTMETRICSLLKINIVTDTVLLNNARKVDD
jgi:hypothetical protein